jgi:aldose 1-epimerase
MQHPAPTGEQFTIRFGDDEATVVQVGGGLRTLRMAARDVVDGYVSDEMATSGRGQLLVPWPNRLDHGRYEWDGRTHQAPINEPDRSNAIHGLVRFSPWTGSRVTEARVELGHRLWPSPGYPFTLDLLVAYQLDGDGLTVTTTARNVGTNAAPYGVGQHPYLLPPVGLTVDECELVVPAEQYVETDDRGLPVAMPSVRGTPFDFRTSRTIGARELDTAFTQLSRDDDGRTRVHLHGDGQTVTVWMDETYRYVQVFTGDTVPAPRRRKSIAVEAMTCPANAFATATDVVRLEPGQAFRGTWGISVSDR